MTNTLKLFKQTTLAIILGSSALLVACANTSTQKDSAWWNDIRNDRYQTVQKHLDKGDFENGFNHQGQTALTYAYREHAFQVYELLLESDQLDINQENQFGETVLMYAALEGDLDRVKELVEKGAKVNKLGWSPLHYASIKGHAEVVEYLLKQGAMPNNPAPDGTSPLFMAVTAQHYKTVELLLAAGADPKAVNQQDKSALDLAKEIKNQRLIDILSK